MSVEREIERALIAKLTKIEDSYDTCIGRIKDIQDSYDYALEIIKHRNEEIRILKQENEDLKGQLRQFGLDLANKGEKRGLFLK